MYIVGGSQPRIAQRPSARAANFLHGPPENPREEDAVAAARERCDTAERRIVVCILLPWQEVAAPSPCEQ